MCENNHGHIIIRTLDRNSFCWDANYAMSQKFPCHAKAEPNVGKTGRKTIIGDLHEGKTTYSIKLIQTKTCIHQHSERINKQQKNQYERLKQNLNSKDEHCYTKLEDSSSFPPNMQAILDEMKQEDVTVEEVSISRMNIPVSDD